MSVDVDVWMKELFLVEIFVNCGDWGFEHSNITVVRNIIVFFKQDVNEK